MTCTRQFVSVVLITLGLLTSAAAQSASFSRTDFPLLGNNQIVADVNGDGVPDLVGVGLNSASVMLGSGNGTFRPKVDFPAGGPTQDVAAGDFNGDGRIDLAVSINDPAISLSLLTGNGDGTFNAPVTFPINSAHVDSPAIVATDLDNDGRLDVVLAHAISCFSSPCTAARTITVLLGFGDGTFQFPIEITVGTGMSRIAVGDFNRDNIKDLAIAGDNSQVYTLLGVGNGTFLQRPTITLTADTLFVDGTDIDVGDLNGDTIQDLVVAIPSNGSRTAILLGNGDGTFQAPRILTEPNLLVPQYQVIADFNRDGFPDLAISLANGSRGLFEIRNGNGTGAFSAPVMYAVPPPLSSVGGGPLASGDFNGDGRPDIVLPITGASPSLAVLVNSTGAVVVPPSLAGVNATPATVASGNTTQLRISLGAGVAPASGLTFAVSSSNSAVLSVPASVVMTAGTLSVTFTGTARNVAATRSVIVTVQNNQLGTRQTTVTVTPGATTPPPPPATDTVRITRAEYDSGKRVLRVEATSTSSSATLQVFVTATGQLLGTLSNNGGGQHRGEFNSPTNPQNITVRSNLGGTAARAVDLR